MKAREIAAVAAMIGGGIAGVGLLPITWIAPTSLFLSWISAILEVGEIRKLDEQSQAKFSETEKSVKRLTARNALSAAAIFFMARIAT